MILRCAIFVFCLALTSLPVQAAPRVVASITPLAALVSAILGEETRALINESSPHGWAMKPSDRRAIAKADLVFWIGPGLETGLQSVLHDNPKSIALVGGSDDHHGHHHGHHHHHDSGEDESEIHPWLNPKAVAALVTHILEELAYHDPGKADLYRANAELFLRRLKEKDEHWNKALAPVKSRAFLTFHGAWQGFSDHFGLRYLGAVSVSPDRPAGARHLRDLRGRAKAEGAVCLMTEPQFPRKLALRLADDLELTLGQFDPLGSDAGPDGYFTLMDSIVASLADCLSQNDAAASQSSGD